MPTCTYLNKATAHGLTTQELSMLLSSLFLCGRFAEWPPSKVRSNEGSKVGSTVRS